MTPQLRLLASYIGRPLQPEEERWLEGSLEDGDTLAEVSRALVPRIREHEWEMAAAATSERLSSELARNEYVVGLAEEARQSLFGRSTPPFATLQEAHGWIVQQGGTRDVRDIARAGWGLQGAFNSLQDALTRLTEPGLKVSGSVSLPTLRIPHEDVETVKALKEPNRKLPLGSAPGERPKELPGESEYLGISEPLRLLAAHAEQMPNAWSLAQATAYILTGETPEIPRWRVWSRFNLPAGSPTHYIELNGPLSFREALELYRMLRDQAGLTRRKSLTPEDVELVEFVVARRPQRKWRDVLAEWNERYPGRQLGKPQTLQNAYRRACERHTRP